MTSAAKQQTLQWAQEFVCPDRVRFLSSAGIDLVIGRREGYRIWDLDGRELIDIHLNGGVFNLGHRNPQVIAALTSALETLDIGNHHFPSVERAELARELVGLTPGMQYAVFASGGGEAIDLAIKSARRVTGRRRIISVTDAYHGHTGLALAAGDEQAATAFLSTDADVVRVPFDDAEALAEALREPTAAVILETVPATAGFPRPSDDYLPAVRRLCDEADALYIADEVQTGLGRSGRMWGVELFDVVPDILVTGKGLSGGIYPIAATLLNERAGQWLQTDGWGHVSTFGGAELGCRVASRVLTLTAEALPGLPIDAWAQGFADLAAAFPQWVVEVRQTGLIIGVKFAHEMGGMLMTRLLFDQGVWAMFAGFDRSVLQVKPGLLMSDEDRRLVLEAFHRACAAAVAL
ncbi:MAG: aminotransferase class III-fold pyridoxal phosphate-dependent enzyme [Candidatus Nanopelagicales bacterium]